MQRVLDSTSGAVVPPRPPGLVLTIFREYWNHFRLFWCVMLPVIIVSLLLNVVLCLRGPGSGYILFFFFNFGVPETQWIFSTSEGVAPHSLLTFDRSNGAFTRSPRPTGVDVNTGVGFSVNSFDIGFLWLAMCPLAYIIVQHRHGVNVTARNAWQHTLRKIVSILGVCILLGLLSLGVGIAAVCLAMTGFLPFLSQDASVGLPTQIFLFLLIAGVAAVYFVVKWSLCNQCVIIENLSAIAALRRSSELVRGAWGQFFGLYLLLILVTMLFTTTVLGLTLLLFSVAAPEFAPMREVLQSGKFFSLFFGGYVRITLARAPIWAVGVMVVVNTLIHATLAPIWATLTTHLYMERTSTS